MKWIGLTFLLVSFMWNSQKECEDSNSGIFPLNTESCWFLL